MTDFLPQLTPGAIGSQGEIVYRVINGVYVPTRYAIPGITVPAAATLNKQRPLEKQLFNSLADNQPIPVVYGQAQVPGMPFAIDYADGVWTIGYALCMGEIDSFVQILVNGDPITEGVDVETIEYHTGTTSQTASTLLSAAIAGYTDTLVHALPNSGSIGIAYIVLEYTTDQYDSWPEVVVELKGLKVYNPSTTTTVWSDNPALHLADHITNSVYGMGKTIDWDSVIDVQTYCDDTTPGEVRRKGYCILDTPLPSEQWAEILRAYASCFIIYRGSTVYLVPDKPGSSIMTLTTDDIEWESLRITKKDSSILPTVMRAYYTDTTTSDRWVERLCDPVKATGVDAGTTPWRESRIRLSGIDRHSQAYRECIERLDKLALADLEVSMIVYSEALELEVADIISVTHSAYGWVLQEFRLIEEPRQVSPGRWELRGVEYSADAYDDTVDAGSSHSDTTLPLHSPPSAVTNVQAFEEVYQLQNGNYASRIRVTWDASSNPYVKDYIVRAYYGTVLVASVVETGLEAATGPLIEGTGYAVSVAARTPLYEGAEGFDYLNLDGSTDVTSNAHVFWQISAPTGQGEKEGDIWFETDNDNKPWTYQSGTWVSIRDGTITVANNNALARAQVFWQATKPTGGTYYDGDIWVRTSDNLVYIYDTDDFYAAQDTAIATAQTTADGKVYTFFTGTTPPTSTAIGDLWIDSDDDNKLYRAASVGADQIVAGEWESVQDGTITVANNNALQAIDDAAAAQDDATAALNLLTDIVDDDMLSRAEKSAVKLQYDTIIAEQTGIDAQATSFGITTEKTAYDNSVSALTTYLGTLTSPVAWNNFTDETSLGAGGGITFRTKFQDVYEDRQALLDAIAAAAKVLADGAQTTADGRNRIFRSAAASPPSSPVEGDLWYVTDENNRPYRRESSVWVYVNSNSGTVTVYNPVKTGTFDAALNMHYQVQTDTTAGFNMNMPEDPEIGDTFYFWDDDGTFATDPLTAVQATSGEYIMGADENFVIDKSYRGGFVYTGSYLGWSLI